MHSKRNSPPKSPTFTEPLHYTFQKNSDRLELSITRDPNKPPEILYAEFLKGPMGYRIQKGGGYKQALAKAVGLKNSKTKLKILDATAGLGKDAFVLASLGASLLLIERSPLIVQLLKDGLRRAFTSPGVDPSLKTRIEVLEGDALDILPNLSKEMQPDVIYLDPMFPTEKKPKSALSKIEMRLIRDIVGEDMDCTALLKLSLAQARKRVVVKRPKAAPALSDLKPSFIVAGKNNRYDVYLIGR